MNPGNGALVEAGSVASPAAVAVVTGDLDNDGDQDLGVGNGLLNPDEVSINQSKP